MTRPFEDSTTDVPTAPRREIPAGLWRLAGILAIAHIVILYAGLSQETSAMMADTADATKATYVAASLGRVLAGGYVESLGIVLLLPVIVFLARAIGRRTEASRWATQTALTAGICYVAIGLGVGQAAGAATLYGAQHGVTDAATLALVGNVRNFAFYLSLLLLGAHAIGTGIAALLDGTMRRWVGWGGICVGILQFAGVAVQGMADGVVYAPLLWTVWFFGLAICLIRRRATKKAIPVAA
jgi:hypothetical protein